MNQSAAFPWSLIGLLLTMLAGVLAPSPVCGEPEAPESRQARVDITLRQVNALLAEHPRFVAPFGFAVTTLIIDGRYLIQVFDDPDVVADGDDWKADVNDLRGEVTEEVVDGHEPLRTIPCRTKGPLREARMGRCWWLGERTDALVPVGSLSYTANPVASSAIRDGIEALIALAQQRELAPR